VSKYYAPHDGTAPTPSSSAYHDFYEDPDYYAGAIGTAFESLKPKYQALLRCEPILPTDDILDIACGRGALARFAVAWGQARSATGFDYSATAIDLARQDLLSFDVTVRQHVTYLVDSATERFPFPDGSFSLIYFTDAIEHFSNVETEHVFDEIERVSRPGARVIVFTCPNRLVYSIEDPIFRFAYLLFKRRRLLPLKQREDSLHAKLHINEQSLDTLRRHLQRHHFTIKICRTNAFQREQQPGQLSRANRLRQLVFPRRWFGNDLIAVGVKAT
jgi:ubiquinone/menaquinone biosynthesis C-methylase UbiE